MGLFKKKVYKKPKGRWIKVDFNENAKNTCLNSNFALDIIHMFGDKEIGREPFSSIEFERLKKEENLPFIVSPKVPYELEPVYKRYFGVMGFYRFSKT